VGKQTFVKSPQMANPQILGLIPLSANFLGVPVRKWQIRKIFTINSYILNFQISTNYFTTLSQNRPKSRLFITMFSNLN
jgi:hypothetical protein